MLKQIFTLACLSTLLSGCSLIVASKLDDKRDGGMDGGGSGNDGGADGGGDDAFVFNCVGMPNGTNCSETAEPGIICVLGGCVSSRCGDSYIDPVRLEECEATDLVTGDGCEPESCQFTCVDATDCDDGQVCNGAETCSGDHRCGLGPMAAPDTACVLEGGGAGACNGDMCAPTNCGNGLPDTGEECDDTNTDNDDGCRNDCTWTCETNDECGDTDLCDGIQSCNSSSHVCESSPSPDCNDSDGCTVDSCDPTAGCKYNFTDNDGDLASPLTTCTTSPFDCDDGNSAVFTGAREMCNGVDDNCNDAIDEDVASVICYPDFDDDHYVDTTLGLTTPVCMCPEHYFPMTPHDCDDTRVDARPFQENFFADPVNCGGLGTSGDCTDGNYDWNCDGVEEKRFTQPNAHACGTIFTVTNCKAGWSGTVVPECGAEAGYFPCGWNTSINACRGEFEMRRQACR